MASSFPIFFIAGWIGLSAASRMAFRIEDHLQPRSAGKLQVQLNHTSRENDYCCCKRNFCSKSDRGVFSPNANLCCTKQYWSCKHPFGTWISFPITQDMAFCDAPQTTSFQHVDIGGGRNQAINPEELTEGSPAHTVHKYCADTSKSQTDEDSEVVEESQETEQEKKYEEHRNQLIGQLVSELSDNSIDTMAKELFSLFICVRWAPDPDFQKLMQDEKATEQLPDSNIFKLYSESKFIPLRCSRNVPVYNFDEKMGSNFGIFENAMKAISEWLESEHMGTMQHRLEAVKKTSVASIPEEAKAFDLAIVNQLWDECVKVGKRGAKQRVESYAPAADFLKDCGAIRWWHEKLTDWHSATPFESFMSPTVDGLSEVAPSEKEHVMVCFGKRVASQLHRRQGGSHLLTDQSAVGCHGFWAFDETSKMINRIIDLWRPPTCQLAAMELDLKVKIMEVIADMNARLFDSLPAIMAEEVEDADTLTAVSQPLEMQGTMGTVGSAIYKFFQHQKKYKRLGQLLGGTVVKWAVCGIQPLDGMEQEKELDSVLTTEDPLARWYAEQAYAKYTGKKNLKPGEQCSSADFLQAIPSMKDMCFECNLGLMEQNHPEPYNNERFVCPKLPLLTGRAQLQILAQHTGKCIMKMRWPQLKAKNWIFEGHMPHHKQYDMIENMPEPDYEMIKVMSWRKWNDKTFTLERDWMSYAMTCTSEEKAVTPRFCFPPKELKKDWLTQIYGFGQDVLAHATGIAQTLEAAGHGAYEAYNGPPENKLSSSPPMNKAYKARFWQWTKGKWRSMSRGVSSWSTTWSNRYNRRFARSFHEMEAAEVLHSASFQKLTGPTKAHSAAVEQYDRFAVVCDCRGFDPKKEFDQKFTNSERALALANAGLQTFADARNAKGFRVWMLGGATLHMDAIEDARTESFAYVRAGKADGPLGRWAATTDSLLTWLGGARLDRSSSTTSAVKFNAFEAFFACGTRSDMHNLGTQNFELFGWLEPFQKCVVDGVKRNAQLRKNQPDKVFFADEIVVHVAFMPLQIPCYHEIFSETERKLRESQATKTEHGEEDNSLYKSFAMGGSGCQDPSAGTVLDLPPQLTKLKTNDKTYRGFVTGVGAPEGTIEEVVMDPLDFTELLKAWFPLPKEK